MIQLNCLVTKQYIAITVLPLSSPYHQLISPPVCCSFYIPVICAFVIIVIKNKQMDCYLQNMYKLVLYMRDIIPIVFMINKWILMNKRLCINVTKYLLMVKTSTSHRVRATSLRGRNTYKKRAVTGPPKHERLTVAPEGGTPTYWAQNL